MAVAMTLLWTSKGPRRGPETIHRQPPDISDEEHSRGTCEE
jgi:hypothetical protein